MQDLKPSSGVSLADPYVKIHLLPGASKVTLHVFNTVAAICTPCGTQNNIIAFLIIHSHEIAVVNRCILMIKQNNTVI